MKVYDSVTKLIGNTPLVELKNIEKLYGLKAKIFAKIEAFNPGGSAKDRIALKMLEAAEKNGFKKGMTVIEPTSGNTGIGLSMIAAAKGYKAVIVMPDSMSVERIKFMKAYGATVVLTPKALGMKGAADKAEELHKEIEGSIIAGQFYNPANVQAHYETTGPEIYEDTDGNVAAFVAGIGTGGTVSGVGRYLKEKVDGVKIFGVEPETSPLITKGVAGSHKIQGIGANFVPENFKKEFVDEVLTVSDEAAFKAATELAVNEGVFAGISSGAALSAAINVAKKEEFAGKNIVVFLPDSGDRYLSVDGFIK